MCTSGCYLCKQNQGGGLCKSRLWGGWVPEVATTAALEPGEVTRLLFLYCKPFRTAVGKLSLQRAGV